MVENYLEYLLLYESEMETRLSEKDYIKGFLLYWQTENLSPDKWSEWVRENKKVFVETGADKELMKEFNSFIIFCQKKYDVDCKSGTSSIISVKRVLVSRLSEFKMKICNFTYNLRDDLSNMFSKENSKWDGNDGE